MRFVFESRELCQGLIAPIERCFRSALDELGLSPVVDVSSGERELERELEHSLGEPHEAEPPADGLTSHPGGDSPIAVELGSRDGSVEGFARAQRDPAKSPRLRLRPRSSGRAAMSVFEHAAEPSARAEPSEPPPRAGAMVELPSSASSPQVRPPSTVSDYEAPSVDVRTIDAPNFDAQRVADLLARRIGEVIMPPSSGSVSGDEAHPNQTGPMLGLVADPSAPGAGHLPERARLRLRPRSTDRALEGLPSPQPTVQLADRSSDVERVGGEQPEAALGRPSIREGRVSVVPRSEPAVQPTDAIDVDAIVRPRTPVTSSASPTPASNLPGSASSLRAVHAPTSASTPAESARARTAAAAGTPTHSLLDALDPNIERTLTTLLRNAARRHGIDV